MKVVCYDSSKKDVPEFFWKRYMQARVGWKKIGVRSWTDMADKLLEALPHQSLLQLQIWGHGAPGAPLIGGVPLPPYIQNVIDTLINQGSNDERKSLIWFRSCSVFFGEKGRQFAEQTSRILGCRVAGHTHIIGPFQSGLYSVSPGKGTDWDLRYDATPWRKVVSGWWEPRTILCTRMSVPEGW